LLNFGRANDAQSLSHASLSVTPALLAVERIMSARPTLYTSARV